MTLDTVIEAKEYSSDSMEGFVKLYAHDKIGLLFNSPEAYRKVAEECFRRTLKVRITVEDIRFARDMRDAGTPEAVINEILNSCSVFDEVHLGGLSLH